MSGRLFLVSSAVVLSLLPGSGLVTRTLAQEPPVQSPPVAKFRSSVDVVSVSAVVRDRS